MEADIVEYDGLYAAERSLGSGKGQTDECENDVRYSPAFISTIVVAVHRIASVGVLCLGRDQTGLVVGADGDANQDHEERKSEDLDEAYLDESADLDGVLHSCAREEGFVAVFGSLAQYHHHYEVGSYNEDADGAEHNAYHQALIGSGEARPHIQ